MEIKFNAGHTHFLKSGSPMFIDTLDNILSKVPENAPKDKLPWLQIFNTGFRVSGSNVNWKYWNGCVFVDIDSKNYYNNVRHFNVNVLEKGLHNFLQYNYTDNFYCIQKSYSGTSYHILFYFDVAKNQENFKKCSHRAIDIVEEAFTNLNAHEILEYEGVVDHCCISEFQGMYISKHELMYNEVIDCNSFGKFDDIDDYELEKDTLVDVDEIKEKLVVFDSFSPINEQFHLGHHDRMMVYTALVGVFGSKEKCDEEWKYICEHLKEGKHNRKFYLKEPDKNKWFERYKSEYAKTYRLEKFGYKFKRKYKPEYVDMFKADVVYELDENERLSDIDLDLKKDRINEIYAGCGLGKTYMSKMLGKKKETDTIEETIDWLFNEGWHSKWVCFISPMRSINKDSFENVDDWCIIDGEHKDDQLNDVVNSAYKKNICTTWESFVLREMYTLDFDYIIVDEIHTLYMYDYRVNSITNLKKWLPNAKGTKVVMTGTPSLEGDEFNCWKIQVKKKQRDIPCDLVEYNDSYKGYIYNDLEKWVESDENHLALIFKDTANCYLEDDLKDSYGLDCDIYNKSYKDVVDYITEHQNVRKQITAFSVYGQAGINLYIDSDKKVRLYILSDNAMSIIQYANRVRNKEVIDKIVVPYKKDNIRNTTFKIDTTIDIEDAKRRLKLIVDQKVIDSDDPIIPVKYERMFRLTYGFTSSCIKVVNDVRNEYELREDNYKNYKLIRNTIDFERQLSVIYSRMKDNYIIMNLIERDKDDVDVKETKQKTNRFCGQVKRMLKENMFEESKISTGYYLKVDEQMKKILTGDSKDRIERVFNRLVAMNLGDKEIAIEDLREFIRAKIRMNKTIKKSDFTKFDTILELKSKWDNAMDAGLITLMLQDVDLMKISAGYVGKIYKAEMKDSDWMKIADETYNKLVYIKKIVSEYEFLLEDELKRNVETLGYQNNYNTQRIYKYLHEKHTKGTIGGKNGGKKSKKNNTKPVTIHGVQYESKKDAMEKLGIGRKKLESLINT